MAKGKQLPEIESELWSEYIDTLPVVKKGKHSKEITTEEKSLKLFMIQAGSKIVAKYCEQVNLCKYLNVFMLS